MGKQPTTGQKKTKDSIARAAMASRKGSKKKWTKGKVKEKLVQNVLLEPKQFKDIEKELPRMKLITIATVTERFKVVASVARQLIRHFADEGKIRPLDFQHQQCILYAGIPSKESEVVVKAKGKAK